MAWNCDFDLSEGLRHADDAIRLLTEAELDAPALLAGALGAKLWLEFLLGHGLKPDLAERASALEQRSRPARAVDGIDLPHGALLKSANRLDEARQKLESVHAEAARAQDDSSKFEVLLELGHLECLSGKWPLARRYAQDVAEFVELTGQEELRPAVLGLTCLIDALQGRLSPARDTAAEALRLAEGSHSTWFTLMLRPVLGFIELSAGQPAEALTHLAAEDEICERIGLREPGRFRFHADYVEALVGCDELDRAAAVLGRFEERGQALGRPWALATAARCRAMLFAARGDPAAALGQVELALSYHQQLAMPFELARTLLAGGQVQRRARHKKGAREMLSRPQTLFDTLGAPAWAVRARDGLSRLGIRPPAPLELTVTERQVAELAAAGMTNREISERMFISLRTTEANLSRVYRKLGIRSRAELARDFAVRGS